MTGFVDGPRKDFLLGLPKGYVFFFFVGRMPMI